MTITFCSLYSGSSGNCLFFSTNRTRILIDAGVSDSAVRRALRSIDEDIYDIDAVLLTHEHSDHSRCAWSLADELKIPVYATQGTVQACMKQGRHEQGMTRTRIFDKPQFEVGDISIHAFSIPHDAQSPVGYTIMANHKKVTIATDLGKMTKRLLDGFLHSDLLFLESNHDVNRVYASPYPMFLKKRILSDQGHLSNDIASKTVCYMAKQGVERVILGHLSEKNNDRALAYDTTVSALSNQGLMIGKDVFVDVAERSEVGRPIQLR